MKSEVFTSDIIQQLHLPNANSRTVAQQVYSVIRKKIITLEIEPGTAMSEKEIADILEVSRTPVREAFIRLNREGLVNVYPQKGTLVSQISISRAREERFLREALEKPVLELFINHHSPEALQKLSELLEKQRQMIEQGDYKSFMQYDDMFHAVFYAETGKKLCHSIIDNYSIDDNRLRHLSLIINEGIDSINVDQHAQIFDCIAADDPEGAQAMLTKHLRKLFTELEVMTNKYPHYFA